MHDRRPVCRHRQPRPRSRGGHGRCQGAAAGNVRPGVIGRPFRGARGAGVGPPCGPGGQPAV
ncbi:MAG: hypothetical protein MZV70_30100 [Desulfobacterales bacterium]|nr:hypothetical protein [Desulfobacterales bacterium]